MSISDLEQLPDYLPLPIAEGTIVSMKKVLIEILQWRLPNYGPEDASVVFGQGGDAIKILENLSPVPRYPFFVVSTQGFAPNVESVNQSMSEKTGIKCGITDSRTEYVMLHVTPIVITMQIMFISNNMNDIFQFALAWMERAKAADISLSIPILNNFPIRVQLMGERELAFSDAKTEDSSDFRMTFTLAAKTYTGWAELAPSIASIRFRQFATAMIDHYERARNIPGNLLFENPIDSTIATQFTINTRTGEKV